MDFFGIGAAMRSMATVYLRSARVTGRTTSLVESVKPGDRVCFVDRKDVDFFKRLLAERGIEGVECITISTSEPSRIFEKPTSQGRTIFDHRWVEEYYLNALTDCEKNIDYFQKESSGFGEPHYKTRRQAAEVSKWTNF